MQNTPTTPQLLELASSFADAIRGLPRNCYWYGYARAEDGAIVPQQDAANPCRCQVPPQVPAAGARIGWPSLNGFAFVGRDGVGEPLAFTDCTGFAAWLVAQTSPSDFAAFQQWDHDNHSHFACHAQPWPSAAAYAYAGYASLAIGNWSVVVNGTQSPEEWITRIQPGDLLAWDIQEVPGQLNDTGHILVLTSQVLTTVVDSDYTVEIIDCSLLQHADDTRPPHTTGVGRGRILLRYSDGAWQYNFGAPADHYNSAPHLSVLRLNV
ncbi:MAG TPA: hypothetical protein VHK68_01755 [Gemmatimonadales bacterium]|nr:hypothetical protein [Gemmatimonadales bacterium]